MGGTCIAGSKKRKNKYYADIKQYTVPLKFYKITHCFFSPLQILKMVS